MNSKKYFMYTFSLLASLGSANAMTTDVLGETAKTTATVIKENPPLAASTAQPSIAKEDTPKPIVKKIHGRIEDVGEIFNKESKPINVQVSIEKKDAFASNLTPDQKLIYNALPKEKTAEDYSISVSYEEDILYTLALTSLQDANRVTTAIMWKYKLLEEKKSQPLLQRAQETISLSALINTLRNQDMQIYCSSQFGAMSPLMKELDVPLIGAQVVILVDRHQGKEKQEHLEPNSL